MGRTNQHMGESLNEGVALALYHTGTSMVYLHRAKYDAPLVRRYSKLQPCVLSFFHIISNTKQHMPAKNRAKQFSLEAKTKQKNQPFGLSILLSSYGGCQSEVGNTSTCTSIPLYLLLSALVTGAKLIFTRLPHCAANIIDSTLQHTHTVKYIYIHI